MSEPLVVNLNMIRHLIAAGNIETALGKLNELLMLQDDAEAHSLRLTLLLEQLDEIGLIQQSLSWLETHQPQWQNLADLREDLQVRVGKRLDDIREEIETGNASAQLPILDELLPLADRFPTIYLTRGLAFTTAAQSTQDAAARLFERRSPERFHRYKSHELPKQAQTALEKALVLLSPDTEEYREAWQILGELHEKVTGDLKAALKAYEQAVVLGMPFVERVKTVSDAIAQQTLQQLVDHVDGLLSRRECDAAEHLLRDSDIFALLPAVQMRWADLDLLAGRLESAAGRYQALVLTLEQPQVPDILDFSVEKIAGIAACLPVDLLSPLAAESALPCVQYEVAYDALKQRALCGLMTAFQRQGNYEGMRETIQRLLSQPDLSANGIHLLLESLKQAEITLQAEVYGSLKTQLQSQYQAEAWRDLLATCRELVSLPDVDAADYAWLSAAMYKNGEKMESLIYTLQQVAPEAFVLLPGDLARSLVRDLAAGGYWHISDPYAAHLSNVGNWRSGYTRRRTAYLADKAKTSVGHLQHGQLESAEAGAQQILSMEADHPQGRLILGQVLVKKGQFAEARQQLAPLTQDAEIGQEALFALIEMDIAEGYLLDAQQRLSDLQGDNPRADYRELLEGLQNQIDQTPMLLVEKRDTRVAPDTLRRVEVAELWTATFAIRLDKVRAVRQVPEMEQSGAEMLTALSQITENLGLTTRFAWRYIGYQGELKIVLLSVVESPAEASARHGADVLWQTLKSMLPLQDEQVYAYKPVMSLPELRDVLDLGPLESAVEIARKEVSLASADADEMYMSFPFGYHQGDMRRLLRALLEQETRTVLDIHFQPTVLLPWERSAIRLMMGAEDSASMVPPSGDSRSQDERFQVAMRMYPEFIRHTQWMAFVVRIHLASSGEMNSALPNIAATGLFGASRYDILPAHFADNLQVIGRNLREVECERWGYSAAPSKLERLRYLLTPQETLIATRIPAPGADGLPGLPALKIKATPVPLNLPRTGTLIGETVTPIQGRPLPVRLNSQDRLRHTYVVGRTGTGKSTLLQNMALQDIEDGHGVGVIDPHGDLVEAILERIPAHRLQDVVLFDPSDTERPIGLNILDVNGTFEQNMVVAEFIGLMYSMFDPNKLGIVGPRFENAVRNAMLTAMAIPGSTLIEVVRILSDADYLKQCLAVIDDPVVKAYWKDIVGNMSDFHRSEVLDYITSKFGRFVTDHLVRNIIGQSSNALDFAGMMDRGQILLVNLAKGKIGPANSHFLGLLLVPRLLIAALSRARMNVSQRRLFSLYVDEFHNFTTPAFSVMLSEARKYGMSLTVANQFISQLDDPIRESVFGNVGTMLAFQVGVKDAHYLAPEMYPVFDVDDMVNLPNYHLLAKMMINGNVVPQFPVRALPDTRMPDPDLSSVIRNYSRQRYGRDAFIVNHEIQQRFNNKLKDRQQK